MSQVKHHLTTETFIEKARSIHGNKYDYSKVNYINNDKSLYYLFKTWRILAET